VVAQAVDTEEADKQVAGILMVAVVPILVVAQAVDTEEASVVAGWANRNKNRNSRRTYHRT
jgi:hypothetical protein